MGCPFLFVVACERNLVEIKAYFGSVLELLLVAVVVCVTMVFECDKMSLNSLYWDVGAPVAHPKIECIR